MSGAIPIETVEIAHLDRAYAHTRILRSRQAVHLAESLVRIGQLLPIVVIAGPPPRFVLIDGYCRVQAARRAGLDTLSTVTEKDGKMLKNRQERRGKRKGAPSRSLAGS